MCLSVNSRELVVYLHQQDAESHTRVMQTAFYRKVMASVCACTSIKQWLGDSISVKGNQSKTYMDSNIWSELILRENYSCLRATHDTFISATQMANIKITTTGRLYCFFLMLLDQTFQIVLDDTAYFHHTVTTQRNTETKLFWISHTMLCKIFLYWPWTKN